MKVECEDPHGHTHLVERLSRRWHGAIRSRAARDARRHVDTGRNRTTARHRRGCRRTRLCVRNVRLGPFPARRAADASWGPEGSGDLRGVSPRVGTSAPTNRSTPSFSLCELEFLRDMWATRIPNKARPQSKMGSPSAASGTNRVCAGGVGG